MEFTNNRPVVLVSAGLMTPTGDNLVGVFFGPAAPFVAPPTLI